MATEPFTVVSVGMTAVMVDAFKPVVRWLDRDVYAAGAYTKQLIEKSHTGHPEPPVSMFRFLVDVRAADLVEPSHDPYAVRVQTFVVCGLPDGHPRWEDYAVTVVCRGAGWWQVRHATRVVSVSGERTPPNRDDCPEDTPDLFMDVDTALQVATSYAREWRWRGLTAAGVLAANAAGS